MTLSPIGLADAQSQLFTDSQQEFAGCDARIQDDGDVGMMRHARQQRAHHRGFAGSHFPGQLDEAAGLVDAVQQMRQGLGVTLTQIEIARIRSDGEGLFAETEEAGVHEP